jgi:hypothetical protein
VTAGPRNFVYWNFDDLLFTVQNRETGRVRRHAEALTLRDADFEIDQDERERMLREGRRTLHAGIRGEIVPDEPQSLEGWTRVVYDPRRHEGFVTADEERLVARAELVRLVVVGGRGIVHARGITYRGAP